MVAQHVPVRDDLLDQGGVRLRLDPGQAEGGLHALLAQQLQHLGRPAGVGAVVDGDVDAARARVGGVRDRGETRSTAAGVADAPACGAPLTTSAWAVYTEAPTASIVTPSAAPATLPYQPRPPLCRAMSRPAFRCRPSSLAGLPESPGTTGQDGRRTSPDASVTDHGHIRGRSRTEQGRPHGPGPGHRGDRAPGWCGVGVRRVTSGTSGRDHRPRWWSA